MHYLIVSDSCRRALARMQPICQRRPHGLWSRALVYPHLVQDSNWAPRH